MQPIHERAKKMNSELIEIGDQVTYDEVNNRMVSEIMQVVCKKERIAFDWDTMVSFARSVSQPCRFEKIKGTKFKIVMDVCHNLQGVQSVLQKAEVEYP
jgi:folylpolyglutamate synthase/dihydropteroate synthase